MNKDVFGLVPIRGFRAGKTRLASALSVEERAAISQWMLNGVISAALATDAFGALAVISPDSHALAHARSLDPRVVPILQRHERPGLNSAVTAGRDWAIARGAAGLAVIFGDLPLLTPLDLRNVLACPAQVVVASDRHGSGTNVSLVRFQGRGSEFVYQYGPGSAPRHEAEAARLGLSFARVQTPGAAFDLDTADDWQTLLRQNGDLASGAGIRLEPAVALSGSMPGGEPAP